MKIKPTAQFELIHHFLFFVMIFHFSFLHYTVGYTTSDVIYKWNGARQAVAIAEDMKLSQFDLVDCPAGNMTDVVIHNPTNKQEKIQTKSVCEYHSLILIIIYVIKLYLKGRYNNILIQYLYDFEIYDVGIYT